MPSEYINLVLSKGMDISQHSHINEVIAEADVVYVTRTQKERFAGKHLRTRAILLVYAAFSY
jgi:aspartate carbamoyltransferase catalytic subunit